MQCVTGLKSRPSCTLEVPERSTNKEGLNPPLVSLDILEIAHVAESGDDGGTAVVVVRTMRVGVGGCMKLTLILAVVMVMNHRPITVRQDKNWNSNRHTNDKNCEQDRTRLTCSIMVVSLMKKHGDDAPDGDVDASFRLFPLLYTPSKTLVPGIIKNIMPRPATGFLCRFVESG